MTFHGAPAVGRDTPTDRTDHSGMPLLALGFGLMTAAVVLGKEMAVVAMVVALSAAVAAWHRTLLRWPVVVGLLISVMLFIPVGRYSLVSARIYPNSTGRSPKRGSAAPPRCADSG